MTFAERIAGAAALGMAILIGSGMSIPPAQAGYVVTLEQVGSNVVATGSGSIDLTGLFSHGGADQSAAILPAGGDIATGPTFSLPHDLYTGFTGPTSFGSGGRTPADSGSGDSVGIVNLSILIGVPVVLVPSGYVSGSALSDTSTYDNQTFGSLGVAPGTYEWTWGTGANQNFTLDAVPAAVPEPSDVLLLALPLGFVILLAARRFRPS